ncbi:MAG TPA: tetratricopeptide repeat protein [Bryobacteraceae bacterium]|jgi:tetratricopeptide (TPR) repeat protein|nr:tetratricopeptide repeat protein [Bryobacteraceae bacterium]
MRTVLLLVLFAITLPAGEPDAQVLFDNGHYKRARDLAEANYRAHPNDARATYLLAMVRHVFAKFDEAVKYGETAVRLDPESSPYHRELGEIYADQADTVSIFKQLGLARKCRAEFEAAIAIAPKDPDNLYDQMLYFLQAPGVVGGDKKKALDIANDMAKINPARGYLALAHIAGTQKEDSKLEDLYKKAVEADPKYYESRISLAQLYLDPQHTNAAACEQQSRAALDLNPDRIDAYRWLAYALVLQKRFDDAAKLLARAEIAVPDDLAPYVHAARAMLREGVELGKAEIYLKKYINETKEPEPDSTPLAGAHWSLGLVYEKEGRKPDARAELETAVRMKPDFDQAKKDLKQLK